jgi:hypothetical protein
LKKIKIIIGWQEGQGTRYEIQNYCEAIAESVGLDLIFTSNVWHNHTNIFIANFQFTLEILSIDNIDSDLDSR